MNKKIYIAAACITDSLNRLLVVRKKGTTTFMQPGGKIEQAERPIETLVREIKEELQLNIPLSLPQFIGSFEAPAANEPGYLVKAELFRIELSFSPLLTPSAEIEEALWLTSAEITNIKIAPLMHSYVIPLWQA